MINKRVIIFSLLSFLFHEVFAQITLRNAEEAAEFAISNSKEFTYQRLSVENNLNSSKLAFQDFLPTFDVSFSEDDSVKIGAADSRSKSFSSSINQLVFDGGKRRLSFDMGKTDALFAYQEYEQAVKQYKSQIISSYYDCLTQKRMYEIKTNLLENARTQLEIINAEYQLGLALETDYLDYLISYKKLENELKQSNRNLKTALRKFNIAIGVAPEVEIDFKEDLIDIEESFTEFEPKFDYLWEIGKTSNLDLRKTELSLYYAKKQYRLSKLIYVPDITLTGGLSFSGNEYPLSEPKFNMKLGLSFSRFPFFPLNFSLGGSFDQNRLNSISNQNSGSFSPQTTYFNQLKSQRISMNQQQNQKQSGEQNFYEVLVEKIGEHDDLLSSINVLKETIALQKRRIEISKYEVEKGEKKRVDFLQELQDLASSEISFYQSINGVKSSAREIEILLHMPFNSLDEVCKQ